MSKHSGLRGGDFAGLLKRFARAQREGEGADREGAFRSSSFRRRGSTASGSTACCRMKGSKATLSIRPRLQHHVGGGGRRPTGSTARHCFVRCWPTSVASRGFARCFGRRRRRRKAAACRDGFLESPAPCADARSTSLCQNAVRYRSPQRSKPARPALFSAHRKGNYGQIEIGSQWMTLLGLELDLILGIMIKHGSLEHHA